MNTFVYLYLCYESHNSSNLPENTENMLQNKYCKTQYESSFLIKILNISILPDDRISKLYTKWPTLEQGGVYCKVQRKFDKKNRKVRKVRNP